MSPSTELIISLSLAMTSVSLSPSTESIIRLSLAMTSAMKQTRYSAPSKDASCNRVPLFLRGIRLTHIDNKLSVTSFNESLVISPFSRTSSFFPATMQAALYTSWNDLMTSTLLSKLSAMKSITADSFLRLTIPRGPCCTFRSKVRYALRSDTMLDSPSVLIVVVGMVVVGSHFKRASLDSTEHSFTACVTFATII